MTHIRQAPLVSVILLSYNYREYLACAIDSVLSQTYPNWELLILENGSTDGSQEIVSRYAGDSRIRLIFIEHNIFPTRCLNQGIAAATGDYISFLLADDYYLPEKLERQVEVLNALPQDYGIVYSPGRRVDVQSKTEWIPAGVQSSGTILRALLNYRRNFIDFITVLVRRECLQRYRFYEDIFFQGEAIFFHIALRYKFAYVAEPLVMMRDHARNMGKDFNLNMAPTLTILDRLGQSPDFPSKLAGDLARLKGRLLMSCGWQSLRIDGNGPVARERMRLAVAAHWLQLFQPRVVLGWCLSWIPRRGFSWVNRLGDAVSGRLRRKPERRTANNTKALSDERDYG